MGQRTGRSAGELFPRNEFQRRLHHPDAKNYVSSQKIYDRILKYESDHKDGLNGFMLMVHFGVSPKRTDKLYDRLDELITELESRGYQFVPITELIKLKK